jgi:hypothetical protein
LVGLGGVGGVVGVVAGVTPPPAPSPASAARPSDVPADVAGFAQLAVGTWLGTGPDYQVAVEALFLVAPEPPLSAAGSDRPLRARRLAAIAAREIESDYWAVTVAADVDELTGEGAGSRSLGIWFFEVGVVGDGSGRLIAVAEPAMVPAPAAPEARPLVEEGTLAVPQLDDGPVITALEGFLGALLTGVGEVDRYTAPGFELPSILPVPFRDVTVDGIALADEADDRLRVRVAVTATTPDGSPLSLSYELTLVSRAGRWEVSALSGAPGLADTASGPDRQSATSTSGSTSLPAVPTTSVAASPGA